LKAVTVDKEYPDNRGGWIDNGHYIRKQVRIAIQSQVDRRRLRTQATMGVKNTDKRLIARGHNVLHLFNLRCRYHEAAIGILVELTIRFKNSFPLGFISEIRRTRIDALGVINILAANQAESFVWQCAHADVRQLVE